MEQTLSRPAPSSSLPRIGRRIALKPYGDELLTRSADFWIFSARLIIVTMALAEALAWGYMGALMSREYPWIAAGIAGLFVFTLIWIIDATFMTLDLGRGYYERALLGKTESPTLEKARFAAGVAARVAIVSVSLFITAPFLAQAIFAGDVRDEMARRNAATVAAARERVDRPFVAQIGELRAEQKLLEGQRVKEAAGIGPSGKYGRGPALQTIEMALADKRREIRALEAMRAATLARFDRLSWSQLEHRFGLTFLAPGVRANTELLGEMMKNPQFTGAELAVRAFLAFLFLGLLILKLFQPRSVSVYFSEQLHSIHDEYRKGLFDGYLPEQERASAGGTMEPLRFEDWCMSTYAQIRREDDRRRETARERRLHDLLVEQWAGLAASARSELDPLAARHATALAAIDELESELHRARASAGEAGEELRRIETARASMAQHIERGGLDATTFQQAIAAAKDLEDRRLALAQTLGEAQRHVDTLTKRLETQRSHAAALGAEIAVKQAVITDAEQKIGDDRMKLAETITRQRALWSEGRQPADAHRAASESA